MLRLKLSLFSYLLNFFYNLYSLIFAIAFEIKKERQLSLSLTTHGNLYKKLGKVVKSDNFCYRKVGRAITRWGAIEKCLILISQY
jgi:hypothetical protein